MASSVEQIKEKLDLVDLIQSYLRLQKAGTNYKALCPFHKERNPSFYVSPSRQMWHCFSCNRGGDHFQFIMEHENVEFIESLKILSKMAGVELRREDARVRTERLKLTEILEKAKEFYKTNLKSRNDVKEYLFERGLKQETIEEFELGYSEANWERLYQHLRQDGYSNEDLVKSGLIVQKNSSDANFPISFYDRFRSRIMFPIHDSLGNVAGFSGRIFEKDFIGASHTESGTEPAKYINTPGTILYDKSKILYGFHKAKNEIRKQNFCVLVEGQMDLIMSHQAGVLNAVGLSGTALTEIHLQKIFRISPNLFFALDPDQAGLLATKRNIDLALKQNFEVKVIELKEDDPADLIKKDSQSWLHLVKSAKPIIDYYLSLLRNKIKDERELLLAVSRIIIPYLSSVQNHLDQVHWVKETAGVLKIKEEPIWEEIARCKNKPKKAESEKNETESGFKRRSRRDLLEERLIGIFCWRRDLISACEKNWEDYFSSGRRPLFHQIILNESKFSPKEHYPQKLALEAELFYNSEQNLELEVKKIFKELEKECLKDGLEILSQKIKEAEIAGDKEILARHTEDFYKTVQKLNINSCNK